VLSPGVGEGPGTVTNQAPCLFPSYGKVEGEPEGEARPRGFERGRSAKKGVRFLRHIKGKKVLRGVRSLLPWKVCEGR